MTHVTRTYTVEELRTMTRVISDPRLAEAFELVADVLQGAQDIVHASRRESTLSEGEYRALVAYLKFWTPLYSHFDLDRAMCDLGIKIPRDDVVALLAKAGHHWDDEKKQLWSDA